MITFFLKPSSFIMFYLSSTPDEDGVSKELVFLIVLYVSSNRWVHFSGAVLFCQPHQQLLTHFMCWFLVGVRCGLCLCHLLSPYTPCRFLVGVRFGLCLCHLLSPYTPCRFLVGVRFGLCLCHLLSPSVHIICRTAYLTCLKQRYSSRTDSVRLAGI